MLDISSHSLGPLGPLCEVALKGNNTCSRSNSQDWNLNRLALHIMDNTPALGNSAQCPQMREASPSKEKVHLRRNTLFTKSSALCFYFYLVLPTKKTVTSWSLLQLPKTSLGGLQTDALWSRTPCGTERRRERRREGERERDPPQSFSEDW